MKIKTFAHSKYSRGITVTFNNGSLKKAKSFYKAQIELRCFCAHDCCGHWFTSHYRIIQKTKNRYEYTVFYAQNI